MFISNSNVEMASSRKYSAQIRVNQSTKYQPVVNLGGINLIRGDNSNEQKSHGTEDTDFLTSFNYAKDKNGNVKELDTTKQTNLESPKDSYEVRMSTMSYLLRMLLYGRMFKDNDFMQEVFGGLFNGSTQALVTEETSYSEEYSQEVSFESTGTVTTADGREINFDYSFSMSESFKREFSQSIKYMKEYSLIDPLVINLDSNPGMISDKKFYFDLDCDGEEEEISNLGLGKGFLALDKNGDGKINDGSELFGTKSGDGFRDLLMYDEDGNGWIDEADSIFLKLRIWSVNEDGEMELHGLKESDVGAIFLGKIDTGFESHGGDKEMLGVVRASGIFLRESTGHAGSIQHVDLAT